MPPSCSPDASWTAPSPATLTVIDVAFDENIDFCSVWLEGGTPLPAPPAPPLAAPGGASGLAKSFVLGL